MAHNEHGDHAHFAHPAPMKLLVGIFLALVSLTILTVVANDWPLGKLDLVVAMTIATVKASLVALFFMHMFWDKGFNIVAFLSSVLFLVLFISMTLMDRNSYREDVESFPVSGRPPTTDYVAPPE